MKNVTFGSAAVPGMMDLHAIPPADRPENWTALRELESELRGIRASQSNPL